MRRLSWMVLWSGCCLVPAASGAPDAAAFFRPPGASAADLAADAIYPRGRQLLFTCYSIKSVHDDWARPGFTALGPYYGAQTGAQFAPYDSPMDAAAARGVKCLYRLGMDIPFLKEHVTPPDAEIAAAVAAQVAAVADRPEIGLWYLTPEELRYWRADEMRYLKTAADAIRAADPQGRPVMLYEPNHRDADALAKTLPHLDVSCRGLYANSTGHERQRAWVRWGVSQQVQAIAQVKPAAAAYAALWMAGDPADPADVARIPAWTRHDVYCSLVNGATGIVIWSGFRRAGFTTFDAYLDGYAACANELNGPLQLSQVFLFGERRDDLQVTVLAGPSTQPVSFGEEQRPLPSFSVLNAAYGEARYLVLVNSAEEAVRARVDGLPDGPFSAEELLPAGLARPMDPSAWTAIDLPPLGVRLWRLRPVGAG